MTLTPDEARLVCMALRQYAVEYATVQDAETLEAVAARIEGEDDGEGVPSDESAPRPRERPRG